MSIAYVAGQIVRYFGVNVNGFYCFRCQYAGF